MVHLNPISASEWLLDFLHARGGSPATLRDAMLAGEEEGTVNIYDSAGVTYGFDSLVYQWTFQIVLWYYVTKGIVIPVFLDQKQKRAWREYFNSWADRAWPSSDNGPALHVFSTPLRLSKKAIVIPTVGQSRDQLDNAGLACPTSRRNGRAQNSARRRKRVSGKRSTGNRR